MKDKKDIKAIAGMSLELECEIEEAASGPSGDGMIFEGGGFMLMESDEYMIYD